MSGMERGGEGGKAEDDYPRKNPFTMFETNRDGPEVRYANEAWV